MIKNYLTFSNHPAKKPVDEIYKDLLLPDQVSPNKAVKVDLMNYLAAELTRYQ